MSTECDGYITLPNRPVLYLHETNILKSHAFPWGSRFSFWPWDSVAFSIENLALLQELNNQIAKSALEFRNFSFDKLVHLRFCDRDHLGNIRRFSINAIATGCACDTVTLLATGAYDAIALRAGRSAVTTFWSGDKNRPAVTVNNA